VKVATAVLAAALMVSGCMSGPLSAMMSGPVPAATIWPGLYTHTRQPLTLDMNRTMVVSTKGQGDIKHIELVWAGLAWNSAAIGGPLELDWAGVAWDSAAIGDIARKQGLKEVYFSDLEITSILNIWNQYTVHVYGQ